MMSTSPNGFFRYSSNEQRFPLDESRHEDVYGAGDVVDGVTAGGGGNGGGGGKGGES